MDPSWVLTVEHLVDRTDSTAYSVAFGVVNDDQDPKPAGVVRVSFTNTDTAVTNPPPTGYGWYDVDPARVHVDNTAIDRATLASC